MLTSDIIVGRDDIPNITIGPARTENTRSIVFDFAPLLDEFGPGTFSLLFRGPGSEESVTVPVQISGTKATWIVTETDTAAPGTWEAEIFYTGNDFCYKTNVFFIGVCRVIA